MENLANEIERDVAARSRVQPHEHPILTRLVVLRIVMNHEFGRAFDAFDHELAQVEQQLVAVLPDSRRRETE